MMLKLKLQYFGHLMWRVDSLEDSDAGRDWGQEEKGTTKDEMAGWHCWLNGRESEWTPGDGNGQGDLACCDSSGRKVSDTTERLNWTEESFLNKFLQRWRGIFTATLLIEKKQKQYKCSLRGETVQEFPSSPAVIPMKGAQVWSLVGELRSYVSKKERNM